MRPLSVRRKAAGARADVADPVDRGADVLAAGARAAEADREAALDDLGEVHVVAADREQDEVRVLADGVDLRRHVADALEAHDGARRRDRRDPVDLVVAVARGAVAAGVERGARRRVVLAGVAGDVDRHGLGVHPAPVGQVGDDAARAGPVDERDVVLVADHVQVPLGPVGRAAVAVLRAVVVARAVAGRVRVAQEDHLQRLRRRLRAGRGRPAQRGRREDPERRDARHPCHALPSLLASVPHQSDQIPPSARATALSNVPSDVSATATFTCTGAPGVTGTSHWSIFVSPSIAVW